MLSRAARRISRGQRWLLLGGLPLGAAFGLYLWHTARQQVPAAQRPALAPGFVGSQACLPCHADIAQKHAESHHAAALHTAAAFAAKTTLPAPQWLPDPAALVSYRVAERDGTLGVEAQARASTHWQPMQWAFGSGTHGMTLVGHASADRFVEAPVSFYRQAGWDFTVGFLAVPPERREQHPTGKLMPGGEAFDCFNCHATGVRRAGEKVVLEGAQLGVQCESCHGGGARHIEAVRRGNLEGSIETPGRRPGARATSARAIIASCGTCHREELPEGLTAADPVAARFAPAGLLQSRCFRESQDTLSCTSCHDPHANSRQDPAFYRAVCAGCHGGKPGSTTCPVQPAGNCVACHMPKKIVQRNSIFTDHWIRALRDAPTHPRRERR